MHGDSPAATSLPYGGTMRDHSAALRDAVLAAAAGGGKLAIRAGGSKAFYGRPVVGEALDVTPHRGIVDYAPSELVLTARCGTPLAEVEALLAAHGQLLPCEPPHFGAATWGGMVAAGLSGPRRPWAGAVRDAVLGVTLLNGRGEILRFGGRVMKNVAGYDVSRLMAGALGSLGVVLEVSLKVLPRPAGELTLVQEADPAEAQARLLRWGSKPLPVSASLHHAGRLYLRLCGGEQALAAARAVIGGEPGDPGIWTAVREQRLPWFAGDAPLWRLALPAAAPMDAFPGEQVVEWGGALRWWRGDESPARLRARAANLGGHATLFRGRAATSEVFQPLPGPLLALHRRLKAAFDPHALFNPGVLYPDL